MWPLFPCLCLSSQSFCLFFHLVHVLADWSLAFALLSFTLLSLSLSLSLSLVRFFFSSFLLPLQQVAANYLSNWFEPSSILGVNYCSFPSLRVTKSLFSAQHETKRVLVISFSLSLPLSLSFFLSFSLSFFRSWEFLCSVFFVAFSFQSNQDSLPSQQGLLLFSTSGVNWYVQAWNHMNQNI